MDNRTLELVMMYLPTFKPSVQKEQGKGLEWEHFELPAAPEADYQFVLYEYSNGEKHIYAKRCGATNEEYFWYFPIELAGFGNDAEQVTREYLDILAKILTHPTRITQKRGFLLATFKCQYLREGEWETISSHSISRFSKDLPLTLDRRHIYESRELSTVS